MEVAAARSPTHHIAIAYLLCILFGPLGLHRYFYDRKVTATLYYFSAAGLGLGWLFDLLTLHKLLARKFAAESLYSPGEKSYNVVWLLYVFLGWTGAHYFYVKQSKDGLAVGICFGIFIFILCTFHIYPLLISLPTFSFKHGFWPIFSIIVQPILVVYGVFFFVQHPLLCSPNALVEEYNREFSDAAQYQDFHSLSTGTLS